METIAELKQNVPALICKDMVAVPDCADATQNNMLSYNKETTTSSVSSTSSVPSTSSASSTSSAVASQEEKEDFRELIATAMMDADEDFVLFRDILKHIWKHHYHWTQEKASWKLIIRHHLVHNDCFVRMEHGPAGYGYYWQIHPACDRLFSLGMFKQDYIMAAIQRHDKLMKNTSHTPDSRKQTHLQEDSQEQTSIIHTAQMVQLTHSAMVYQQCITVHQQ